MVSEGLYGLFACFIWYFIVHSFVCLLGLVLGDSISQCNFGWPRTLRDLPASVMLGVKVCATMLSLVLFEIGCHCLDS